MKIQQGFTLIELMVTIAVMAIIALIAAPSFNELLVQQKLKSTAYSMRETLKLARSHALMSRSETVVCPSFNKSAVAVTQVQCEQGLTDFAKLADHLKKDSVFIVNVEKKIKLKSDSDDSFVFSARGNLMAPQSITFCSSAGSYILSVDILGSMTLSQAGAC